MALYGYFQKVDLEGLPWQQKGNDQNLFIRLIAGKKKKRLENLTEEWLTVLFQLKKWGMIKLEGDGEAFL